MPTPDARTSLTALARYRRAADYLGAAQIYLRDNVLLREPLRAEHIKPRLLGHWGTVPGINLVYAHLDRLVLERGARVLMVTGPGHGAPANLANLYLEGSLEARYPEYTRDQAGLARLVKNFSWPGGFPSHLTPATPGVIHEGGELGYALATAFGAALDNPDLIVACMVGDGEAETGPTATAWHCTKYLDPERSGAVLPVLHINGYKISSRTVSASMSDDELRSLFSGYGWTPMIVDATGDDPDAALAHAMDAAYELITSIQRDARSGNRRAKPAWPMILLRSPKGRGCPKEWLGKPLEGTAATHQVPIANATTDARALAALEGWLRSYKPEELFDEHGRPVPEVLACCPAGDARIGMIPEANGGARVRDLPLPALEGYALAVRAPDETVASAMAPLGAYLRDVMRATEVSRDFRIVCPDELASNKLSAVLDATDRAYQWPLGPHDTHVSPGGRVMETLSEHTCQAWLQGYLLTGRHGLFPCYEAFIPIVDGMMNQFAKFLKQSSEVSWRGRVASLNYLLTSDGWRQDHNGYSHQGPGFINAVLDKKAAATRVYLPPDANTLLCVMERCLQSRSRVNLVIATKNDLPQYFSLEEARALTEKGAAVVPWGGSAGDGAADVVLAFCGATPALETLAAAEMLRADAPWLRVRVVSVLDLLSLDPPGEHPHGLSTEDFEALFPRENPVVFAFHGYPSAVKQLLFGRPDAQRFSVRGYREEGTTTTPFDMTVRNGISRYHLAMAALRAAKGAAGDERTEQLCARYQRALFEHRAFILARGCDPKELTTVGARFG